MKTTYLIITYLFFASAWAYAKHPLALFANINGTLKALSGYPFDVDDTQGNILSYGNSSAAPVEFVLQGNYIYTNQTSTPESVGFFRDGLVFGPKTIKARFDFNNQSMITNHSFKSCPVIPRQLYLIFDKIAITPGSVCIEVDIYLLPFDKKTGAVLNNVLVPEEGRKDTLKEQKEHESKKKKKYESNKDERHNLQEHKPVNKYPAYTESRYFVEVLRID